MENQGKKKYEVTVLEKTGSCDNELFEEMTKNGDITAVKVADVVGAVVKILGYAKCQIVTDDKNFTIGYYDTEEYGLVSSGSEIFEKSVKGYFGKVSQVRISEVKTSKGKTYKAVPQLRATETKKEETINNDELPF